jgi:ABC-2 type transport system permease protein
VRAVYRKELREFRRNRTIVASMAFIPLGILAFPLLYVVALPASSAGSLLEGDPLVILLGIPALVPSVVATYAVVGERQQGTLEPVLTTPVRREEFVLGKALAALAASLVVSYAVYAFFLTCTKLLAQPAVASAVLQPRFLVAQVLFTPLLAGWSIWIGMAISTRTRDVRVAQQIGTLAALPPVLITYLVAFDVIHATPGLVIAFAAALLILDGLGWRLVPAVFDRERLVTGMS